jgi:hypothetical protein
LVKAREKFIARAAPPGMRANEAALPVYWDML